MFSSGSRTLSQPICGLLPSLITSTLRYHSFQVMGPDCTTESSGNQSPLRFTWDIWAAPWTDVKRPQDKHAEAVADWCDFHDLLPASNGNKLAKKLGGPILKAQCFGRAKDLDKSGPRDKLNLEYGVQYFVNSIHKSDPLSFFSGVQMISTGYFRLVVTIIMWRILNLRLRLNMNDSVQTALERYRNLLLLQCCFPTPTWRKHGYLSWLQCKQRAWDWRWYSTVRDNFIGGGEIRLYRSSTSAMR